MLPIWAIRALCEPYGHRMPKLPPPFEQPKPKTEVKVTKIAKGNLENAEYEFWAGCIQESATSSICRCCGRVATFAQQRVDHKVMGCNAKLKEAYKLLCKDMKCVMCDEDTGKKIYGVPVCSVKCLQDFKFGWTRPISLTSALALVAGVRK